MGKPGEEGISVVMISDKTKYAGEASSLGAGWAPYSPVFLWRLEKGPHLIGAQWVFVEWRKDGMKGPGLRLYASCLTGCRDFDHNESFLFKLLLAKLIYLLLLLPHLSELQSVIYYSFVQRIFFEHLMYCKQCNIKKQLELICFRKGIIHGY